MIAFILGFAALSCTGESEELVQTDEQVITLQAISSSLLLSYEQGGTEEMSMMMDELNLNEEDINDIDKYVEIVEAFLGNDQLEVETGESELEEFDYKVIYRTYTLNQDSVFYTLHYNLIDLEEETTEPPVTTEEETTEAPVTTEEETTEAPVTSEEEITTETPVTTEEAATETTTQAPTTNLSETTEDHRPDDCPFMFEDEDDDMVVQGIVGQLEVGERVFDIEGKVLNVNGKEIIRLRSYIDEDNFVLVNYQTDDREVDKEKFFFQMVEEGVVVNRSRIMLFENENMQHVQLEFINGDNYERYQFHIRERNDVTYIHINYRVETEDQTDQGNIRLTKTIDPETGEAIYEYNVTPGQGGGQGGNFNRRHRRGRPDQDLPPQTTTSA